MRTIRGILAKQKKVGKPQVRLKGGRNPPAVARRVLQIFSASRPPCRGFLA